MQTQGRMGFSSWRWTLLTAVGLAAGLLAALGAGAPIGAVVGMILVTPVVTGLVGVVLGSLQGIELRGLRGLRRGRVAGWWIGASALGMAAGLSGGVTLVEQIWRAATGGPVNVATIGLGWRLLSFAVIGLLTGAAVGFLQAWVLRRIGLPSRGWIAANALGLSLGLVAGSLAADTLAGGLRSPLGLALLVAIAGLLFGALPARLAAAHRQS